MNILEISAVNEQSILADGFMVFDTIDLKRGCNMRFIENSNNVNIKNPGIYKIFFSADFEPVNAEEITVTIENNGVTIAETTFTGVLNVIKRISFMKAFAVLNSCKCVINFANIKIKCSAPVTVTNATLLIEQKEA